MKKLQLIISLLMALIIVISCDTKNHVRENLKTRDAIFQLDALAEDWEDYTSDIGIRFGDKLRDEITNESHNKPFILNVLKDHYNDYQKHWMNVAYRISGDKEFMYMLASENSLLNHDRRSLVVTNGIREPSYGFCQIHRGYHPQIVNDNRFWNDPEWQLEQCYRLWKGGTPFYGYDRYKKGGKFATIIRDKFTL